ncbi:MAG: hypothetical protein ACXWI4_01380 [Croceibacterium sp.]
MRYCHFAAGLVAAVSLAAPCVGQRAPADLTSVPPVPNTYVPKKTPWGDPDFRATWTGDNLANVGVELERPADKGNRLWLTDEEFAKRLAKAKKSDSDKTDFDAHLMPDNTIGLAAWLQASPFGRRTSLIVSPANGRLPPLTPRAEALFKAGRTSWNKGQPIDWVSDLDAVDRCITRGFPSAMLPSDRDNDNGIRIFQAPGFVAFQLEILGTRVIPIGKGEPWPAPVHGWLGHSRGHWEGNTLVIETANIVPGDSATGDALKRAASPSSATSTIPTGEKANTVERLTMTGPGTLVYQATYSDPDVFTAPWTVQVEWARDDKYRLYEFACHEGNRQVRDLISSSRAQRKKDAAKAVTVAGK